MLVGLSVRDVVLIDRLDLSFESGLSVLTGETGAGKSILLDALGLALGNRADAGLLRPGAKQASVAAVFEVEPGHPARAILDEREIEAEDGLLVLRRLLGADGRSRAFVKPLRSSSSQTFPGVGSASRSIGTSSFAAERRSRSIW